VFNVSRLGTDHVDAVLDLESAVYAHENKGQTLSNSERNRRWQSWFINLDQEITYGVFKDEQLVCYVNAKDINPGLISCFRIEAVNTHPEYRGNGLAKASLHSALQEIEKRAPKTQPYLYVPQKNAPARNLYEKFGFAARGDEEGYKSNGVFLMRMDRQSNQYPDYSI
jgi:predicted GNAT family acetyltransferase